MTGLAVFTGRAPRLWCLNRETFGGGALDALDTEIRPETGNELIWGHHLNIQRALPESPGGLASSFWKIKKIAIG
jgi:hypothetical protein